MHNSQGISIGKRLLSNHIARATRYQALLGPSQPTRQLAKEANVVGEDAAEAFWKCMPTFKHLGALGTTMKY